MQIYEKNITSYEKKYGSYETVDSTAEFQLEKGAKGYPTVKYGGADGRSTYLHSKYDPIIEARRWADNFYEAGQLFVLIGFALGYQAWALYEKMEANDHLLIIEPFKTVFQLSLNTVDISELLDDERIIFHIGNDDTSLQAVLNQFFQAGLFKEHKLCVLPLYEKLFPGEVLRILKAIEAGLLFATININTMKVFAEGWQENYLKNIKSALTSQAFRKFEKSLSLPVIIVSAGPSLTEELENLKSIYDRALIIAAGSAVSTLAKNHLKPHLIVSMDGGYRNYEHFQKISYEDVPLFYSPMLHHKIAEEYKGPKVVFQFKHAELFDYYNQILGFDTGTVTSGPSVANACLDIALKMSTGPVCFIGQDLGYTGGYSHAEGNINRSSVEESDNKQKKMVKVDSNDGSELWSDYPFIAMKKWFEEYIKGNKIDRVYNATLQGAKIKGTKAIKFTDFIDEYCGKTVDVEAELLKLMGKTEAVDTVGVSKKIASMIDSLELIDDLSFQGKKAARKLLDEAKNEKNKKTDKLIKELDHIDEQIKNIEEKDVLLYFIKNTLMIKLNFWKFSKTADEQEKRIDIAKQSLYLYEEMNKIAGQVKSILTGLE